MNSSKDQTVLEKSVHELGVHSDGGWNQERTVDNNQLSDELRDAKAMVRHLWKAVKLHEQHYNKIKRESTNSDCLMEL
jgi:hypothetical protein